MRGALHEFLHIGHALKRLLNHSFVSLRNLRFAAELFHVITVRGRARHPAGGSMRLLKVAGVSEVGHYVANCRRAQAFATGPRQHARPHRLARGDKGLHDGREYFPFAIADWLACRHTSLYTPFCRARGFTKVTALETILYLNRLAIILAKWQAHGSTRMAAYLLDEQSGLLDLDHAFWGIGLYLGDALHHVAREVKQRLGVGR